MLSQVSVKQLALNRHTLSIDGKDISDGTVGVNIDISAGEVTECTVRLDTWGAEFDGVADVRYDFTPSTVTQAANVLRNELIERGDLYTAFVDSAVSALKDLDRQRCGGLDLAKEDFPVVAKAIINRLIGEEDLHAFPDY